jgi:hypothetical protein
MKEISVEQKTYITKWEAADGTQFDSNKECEKYENSAKCVVFAKYRKFVIRESSEYDLFGVGTDDSGIDVVNVSSQEAVDIIFQAYCFNHLVYSESDFDKIRNEILDAFNRKAILLIGRGYSCEDFWIMGTLEDKLAKIREKALKSNK